jgi:hypothetical protein
MMIEGIARSWVDQQEEVVGKDFLRLVYGNGKEGMNEGHAGTNQHRWPPPTYIFAPEEVAKCKVSLRQLWAKKVIVRRQSQQRNVRRK